MMRLPLQICLLQRPRRWGFCWRPGYCFAAIWLGYIEVRLGRRYIWEDGSTAPFISREPISWTLGDRATAPWRINFSFRSAESQMERQIADWGE